MDSVPGRPTERPALVSVVIPVCNEEEYLGDQLKALSAQTYTGEWEVLIVDNGSTDRSVQIANGFASRLPLRIVDASAQRSINHARNAGVAAALGEFVAFCDGDDVVAEGWLEALVTAGATADIVTGRLDSTLLNDAVQLSWRPGKPQVGPLSPYSFLPSAAGGNCGMWARVAQQIGWNEEFRFGGCDVEFSWRAQLAGFTLAFAPDAVIHLRHRSTLRSLARQYFSYGRAGPLLYRHFRTHGMRWDGQNARDRWRWIAQGAWPATRSVERRGNWVRLLSFSLGRVYGSARWRVCFL